MEGSLPILLLLLLGLHVLLPWLVTEDVSNNKNIVSVYGRVTWQHFSNKNKITLPQSLEYDSGSAIISKVP